jgi:antitoxin component YwqK of YwqJK toxin-antitoxin module
MLTFLLTSVSFVLLCQQKDSLTFKRYFYEGGAKSSEGYLKEGKPEGYWRSYYRNGNLKTEGNRKGYLLDSTWSFYAEDGNKTLEINYTKDRKNGPRKTFKEGKVVRVEPFKDDAIQGFVKEYDMEGNLIKEIPFVDNVKKGAGYGYAKDGRITELLTYKANVLTKEQRINRRDNANQKQGLWIDFYPSKMIKVEGPYVNDLRNGYWKYYQPNGNLIRVEKWVMGELIENAGEVAKIDVKTRLNPNTGKVAFRGTYRNGVEEGVHREYNDSGQVVSGKIYSNGIVLYEGIVDEQGRKQGPWKEYYETGELKAEGKYRNDEKIQDWKYYYRNGKIEQKGEYFRGLPEGMWVWNYEDGSTWRMEEYAGGLEDGSSVEYNDTGAVIAKGSYVEGLKEGKWTMQVNDHFEEGTYFEGLRSGEWKHYYQNTNELRFKGNFENGLETGLHSHYYPSGQLKERGNYIGGVKDGVWEYLEEDGSTKITIEYDNGEEIRYNGKKISFGKRIDKELAKANQ